MHVIKKKIMSVENPKGSTHTHTKKKLLELMNYINHVEQHKINIHHQLYFCILATKD